MEEYLPILKECPLFAQCDENEIADMLNCLSAKRKRVPAKSTIFMAGTRIDAFGVVLSGGVDILQEDFWGNQRIIARLSPGQIFAESFALAGTNPLPVSVIANRASEVLLLNCRRILHTCPDVCPRHERLIGNLLLIAAQKNVYLTQKMEIVTRRTIKERLLAYLSDEAKRAGSARFTIPYDRQALAEYLAVDRSALSRALGEMRDAGILTFSRNVFELKGFPDAGIDTI